MISDYDKISKGYVKFWRSFIDWEWFTEVNTCHLFQYCILRANHSDTEWRGIKVLRGSFITSREHLAIATGLSEQNVRTALKNLKLTNEITYKSTNNYSIITVNNYDMYQDYVPETNQQNNNQITECQPTPNQLLTTDNKLKNDKNDKNNININKKEKLKFGEFKNVLLTEDECSKLKELYEDKFNEAIEILSNYLKSKGKEYKDYYAVLRKNNWVYEKVFKENTVKPAQVQKQEVEDEVYNYGF